jgi:hypothetical protein
MDNKIALKKQYLELAQKSNSLELLEWMNLFAPMEGENDW